jgi:uncharacterized membrane protein YgdD (TMEM256/DUF423 family)
MERNYTVRAEPEKRQVVMDRIYVFLGALAGLVAVAMAAAAAHGLAGSELVDTAVRMQFWHALALLAAGLWAAKGGLPARLAGAFFAVGIVLFCGDLYALALGGWHVPFAAPAGGTLLLLGWLLLALSALRPTPAH